MEAENNMDDLLVRYLFNESGAEEKKLVLDWLNESEQNRAHFESLKKTVDLLMAQHSAGNIDVEAEWKYLQGLIAAGAAPVNNDNEITEAEDVVREFGQRRRTIYRWLIPAAAAAAIFFAVYLGGFFNNRATNQLASSDTDAIEKISPANAVVHHEINNTGKVKSFSLPDGSVVRLSASSELTYSEPSAGGHRRNIILRGEADFAVAKDKTKPFTVFSGDISTMAVGTRFTVTAFEADKFIQVKLEEGKVLVKSERKTGNKLTDNLYLTPGQQLIYDKNQQTARIRSFGNDDKNSTADNAAQNKSAGDNPLLPAFNNKSWFMFNNQSLAEIFHSLELMYDVKIEYTKKDIDQRYFIGTFSKSDSVENILQQIAVLNKLTVIKKDNTFTLYKK